VVGQGVVADLPLGTDGVTVFASVCSALASHLEFTVAPNGGREVILLKPLGLTPFIQDSPVRDPRISLFIVR